MQGCGDEVRASLRYLVQGVLAVVGILLFLEVLPAYYSDTKCYQIIAYNILQICEKRYRYK